MATIDPGKAGITRADIQSLVAAFYARIRQHPHLGPIFARHVHDWGPHEAKIAAFWSNVMLHDRAYRGNPMQAHLGVPGIGAGEFRIWLDLFQATAAETLPAPKAAMFDMMARRIGRSLAMGLERERAGGPPNLLA